MAVWVRDRVIRWLPMRCRRNNVLRHPKPFTQCKGLIASDSPASTHHRNESVNRWCQCASCSRCPAMAFLARFKALSGSISASHQAKLRRAVENGQQQAVSPQKAAVKLTPEDSSAYSEECRLAFSEVRPMKVRLHGTSMTFAAAEARLSVGQVCCIFESKEEISRQLI